MSKKKGRGNTPSKDMEKVGHPPLLLETSFTVSRLVLILAGASTAVLTFIGGGGITTILIRSGVTILILGLLLWLINYLVARAIMEQVRSQVNQAVHDEGFNSTSEWNA